MITKTFYTHYAILFIVLVLFLVTRLYQLNLIPASLYWDEASIGVNAYSVLKTGHDEWGQFLPVHFKAFGEYKLPVYIYSVVLTESILGLNELAVRLPAVIYSLGTILVAYFLTGQLWEDKRASLLTAFLLVITPWFFIFSRTGYEVTAGLFFLLLGILLFFKGLKNPPVFFLSTLSFLLSIYSYNSFRILLPFLSIYFAIYLLKKHLRIIKKSWPVLLLCLVFFLIFIIPIGSLYFSSDGLKRFDQVGIYHPGDSRKLALINFSSNYLSHFNPYFLFLTGDGNLRSHVGEVGELFWIALPFIIIGLIVMFKKRNLESYFILFLLLIAPIPAALTRESPHALRTLLMVIPFSIITAVGIQWTCAKSRFNIVLLGSVMLLFCLLFSLYFQRFSTVYPKVSAVDWQYGYAAVFSRYGDLFNSYDHVLISDRYSQPYVYDAFYRKLNPQLLQNERVINQEPRIETSVVRQQGNVIFDDVKPETIPEGNNLIFAHPDEKLADIFETQTILNPDNSVAFYVYEFRK